MDESNVEATHAEQPAARYVRLLINIAIVAVVVVAALVSAISA